MLLTWLDAHTHKSNFCAVKVGTFEDLAVCRTGFHFLFPFMRMYHHSHSLVDTIVIEQSFESLLSVFKTVFTDEPPGRFRAKYPRHSASSHSDRLSPHSQKNTQGQRPYPLDGKEHIVSPSAVNIRHTLEYHSRNDLANDKGNVDECPEVSSEHDRTDF